MAKILDHIHAITENATIFRRLGIRGTTQHGHLTLEPLAAAPTKAGVNGRLYFSDVDDRLHQYDDTLDLIVPGALRGSKTHDFASIADGANASTTVTVTGAALGDAAIATLGVALTAGVIITAYVSAADTVTVVVSNESGGAYDAVSTTLRATVIKLV